MSRDEAGIPARPENLGSEHLGSEHDRRPHSEPPVRLFWQPG